jgi:hypothetical protein
MAWMPEDGTNGGYDPEPMGCFTGLSVSDTEKTIISSTSKVLSILSKSNGVNIVCVSLDGQS